MAPTTVHISRVMPSRMFAIPRATFFDAAELDVAITQISDVAMALCIGTFSSNTRIGMIRIPPPSPNSAPTRPAANPDIARMRMCVMVISGDWLQHRRFRQTRRVQEIDEGHCARFTSSSSLIRLATSRYLLLMP